MKKFIFLLTFCTTLLAASCNKDDDTTPSTTNNDHRIVRCKVNGEEWTPLNDGSGGIFSPTGPPYDLQYYSDTGRFEFHAGNAIKEQGITIISDLLGLGINNIIDNDSFIHFSDGNQNTNDCIFYKNLNKDYNNQLIIESIDSIEFIITGTFDYSAVNNCLDTIYVTDGYFDLHYRF